MESDWPSRKTRSVGCRNMTSSSYLGFGHASCSCLGPSQGPWRPNGLNTVVQTWPKSGQMSLNWSILVHKCQYGQSWSIWPDWLKGSYGPNVLGTELARLRALPSALLNHAKVRFYWVPRAPGHGWHGDIDHVSTPSRLCQCQIRTCPSRTCPGRTCPTNNDRPSRARSWVYLRP